MQVINGRHPIIVSGNSDLAFHFQLLVLIMMCENSCFIFIMILFFLLQIYIPMHMLHVYPHNLNLPFKKISEIKNYFLNESSI